MPIIVPVTLRESSAVELTWSQADNNFSGLANGIYSLSTVVDGLVSGGTGSPSLSLSATSQTFKFNSSGSATPSGQSITIAAQLMNLAGSPTFVATAYDITGASLGTIPLTGSGLTRALSVGSFASAAYAIVVATLSGASDQMTIVRLTDGAPGVASLACFLTNESVTVAADNTGAVADFSGAGGTFRVFQGLTEVTGSGVAYSVASSSNVTISINATSGVYSVSAMSAASGVATLQAVYGGVTLTKVYNIAKSQAGATGSAGAPGVGAQTATVYLYQWAPTTPSGPNGSTTYTWATGANSAYAGTGSWSSTVPANPGTAGLSLWLAAVSISAATGVATSTVNWTGAGIAAYTQNGATGPGGSSGVQAAYATVYQWAPTIPTGPTGAPTYTWATASFGAAPAGWSLTAGTSPSQGFTLWAAAVLITDSAANATTAFNWSSASITARGYAGVDGSGGVGSTGPAGASARIAYAVTNLTSLASTPTTYTTSGSSSFPPTNTWGGSEAWQGTVPSYTAGQAVFQIDGIYSPSTGNTVWGLPYLSALKVGSLSAITTNTGALTVTGNIAVTGGALLGGAFTGYAWPPSGNTGFYLGPSGLLLGNANDGKFLQVTAGGDIYTPGFTIVGGVATFSAITITGGAIQGIGTGNATPVANSLVSIGANGALSGAGGGQVTIGGLGYTGALNATYGATWGGNVSGIPSNLAALTGSEGIQNSAITVSGGVLSGIGTAGVVVDNSLVTAGSIGAVQLVLVNGAGTAITGAKVTKTAATNGWDSSAYSKTSYTGGAYLSFTIDSAGTNIMGGLSSNPTAGNSYTQINYALYAALGTLYRYESGSQIESLGAYAAGDVLTVSYDGSNVRYFKNGTLLRAVAVAGGQTLYFDASFYQPASSISAIAFGPMSANNWSALGSIPTAIADGRVATAINGSGIIVSKVVPGLVAGPTVTGLYMGSDYMGFYNASSSSWKTYMDNAGNFYLGGTTGALQWNGATLSMTGNLIVGSSPAVAGTSMTGTGGVINVGGTFALGNATTNISFNGSVLTLNGAVVTDANLNLSGLSATLTGGTGVSLTVGDLAAHFLCTRGISASGGTTPYTYQWSIVVYGDPTAGTVYLIGDTTAASINVYGRVATLSSNVSADVTCTVTDANGRTKRATFNAYITGNA